MFDLPVGTIEEQRAYRKFRKFLINEGFIMHQYSVYSKLVLNSTAKNTVIKKLEINNPKQGDISILTITEKQFSKMLYLHGIPNSTIANTDSRVIFLGDNNDKS